MSQSFQGVIRGVYGYFGGTFDPIHNGHLRMAIELQETLGFDQFALVPCHQPPHRQAHSDDRVRAQMVSLALEQCPGLQLDPRELERDSLSYSIDTLQQLRDELGDAASISWCVGMDSLVNIGSWHRWRELLDYAHLVVVARPGWQLPQSGEVADWLQQHRADTDVLHRRPCGAVVIQPLSLLQISATDIRQRVASGNSVQFLLPEPVRQFIEQNGLYRRAPGESENPCLPK
ncbi:MAG: nicotinate-nucleotide adenylyltransferase [Candidatus Pelagadaptatus aseana]|uniref:nicotinate-nucleotide adenylyltransferase n=1 Tax=Candidatus Pelagadaptatus aseana TaxID=3120508 RepID=UPI0039B177DE